MAIPPIAPSTALLPTDAVGNVCTGGLEVDFSVTPDGASTLRLPLWVPPGRGGIQPELSLQYDSRSDHGLLGVGWGLTGLPIITRCPKRYSSDGVVAAVKFDESDEFCLSGERLIAVGGIPGTDGAEYRTRRESFARIKIVGADRLGPATFEVRKRNGQILTFEPDANAKKRVQIIPKGKNPQNVKVVETDVRYSWSVRTITDRNGNTLEVVYDWVVGPPNSALLSEFLPVEIQYTQYESSERNLQPLRSVRFHYGTHAEPTVSYVAGLEIRQAARLEGIEMWGPLFGNPELLRFYELRYQVNQLSHRSLLRSIRECDGWPKQPAEPGGSVAPIPKGARTGVCKLPLILDWQTGSTVFEDMNEDQPGVLFDSSDVTGLTGRLLAADLDGDGCDDLVCTATSVDGREHCAVVMSNGFKLGGLQPLGLTSPIGAGLPQPIDFDMDARVEFLMSDDSVSASENVGIFGIIIDPVTRLASVEAKLYFPSGQFEVADLVGNRLADLILPYGAGTFWQNTGLGFFQGPMPLPVPPIGDPRVNGQHLILDIDGDGAMEVLCPRFKKPPSGGLLPIPPQVHGLRYFAVGYGKAVVEVNLFSDSDYVFADINGDGLVDAIEISGAHLAPNSFTVWINTGNGFQFGVSQTYGVVDLSTAEIRVINYSQDGRQQLLLRPMTGLMDDPMVIMRWNGSQMTELPLNVSTRWTFDDAFGVLEVLDADGDGLDDFVMMNVGANVQVPSTDGSPTGDQGAPEPTPKLHLYHRKDPKADLLIGITDPLGRYRSIQYEPLTGPGIYTDTQTCSYPMYPVRAGRWVVAKVTDSDGLGGTRTLAYSYEDGRADVLGEGFLGFLATIVSDPNTGIVTRSIYDPSLVLGGLHPLAGLPQQTITRTPLPVAGERVRTIDYTYESRTDPSGRVVFAFAQLTHVVEQDVNGGSAQTVRDIATSQDFDAFGNMIKRDTLWADGSSESYRATFTPDVVDWIITIQDRESVTSTDASGLWQQRNVAYSFDDLGQMILKVTEPGLKVLGQYQPLGPQADGLRSLFTAYTYNPEGTVARIDQSESLAPVGAKRSVIFAYDDSERMFPVLTTNSLGQSTGAAFLSGLGQRAVFRDANGLQQFFQFDLFGRIRGIRFPSGEALALSYVDQPSVALPLYVPLPQVSSWLRADLASGARVEIAYDVLGRSVLNMVHARDDGQAVLRQTIYDSNGWIASLSEPFFPADAPRWSQLAYDALGRLTKLTRAYGGQETFDYSGVSINLKNARGRSSQIVLDDHGRPISQSEPLGMTTATTTYEYGPFDTLRGVTDPGGMTTRSYYDRAGRPIRIIDKNSGDRRFGYTSFGELLGSNRNGDIITFAYDPVGRLSSVTAPEGQTVYTWDTATHGIGQLAQSKSSDGVSIKYGYDALGRDQYRQWVVNGENYRLAFQHDQVGRVSAISYPQIGGMPFIVTNNYGNFGELTAVSNPGGDTFWKLTSTDASGSFGRETLGNGTVNERTESPQHAGLLDQLRTYDPQGDLILNLEHQYDANENLTRRTDWVLKVRESCVYDDLDRLVSWDRASAAGRLSDSWTYNEVGDIVTVTRFHETTQNYVYESGGSNAVEKVAPASYLYDKHGNQIAGPERKLTYTWFGLPSTMKMVGKTFTFLYDADQNRVRTAAATGSEVVSIGGLYVRRQNDKTQRFIVRAFGRPVAEVSRKTGKPDVISYLHLDHLGSLQATTDQIGQVKQHISYDPFGARLDPAHPRGPSPTGPEGLIIGFTGHDGTLPSDLIDMRGRWYDPKLRRFLSPDPLKNYPAASQAQNAYSYVLNNPLSWNDPSGFAADDSDGGDPFISLVMQYESAHPDDSFSTLNAAVDWAHQQMTAAGDVANDAGLGGAGIADAARGSFGGALAADRGSLIADARAQAGTDFWSRTRRAMSDAGSGIRSGVYDFESKYGEVPGWKWGLGAAGLSLLVLAPYVTALGFEAGSGGSAIRLMLTRAGLPATGAAITVPRIATDPNAVKMFDHMLKHMQGLAPANASYFYGWISRLDLISAAEEFPAYFSRGNLARIAVWTDPVGWDRISQSPTYYYTVVTTMLGNFISMYPGLPEKPLVP
jgi:RHS repeat-associated protein